MCGINGFSWDDEDLIQKMNNAIKHRGPDDEGFYRDNNVSLGNVRLSIIDLSEHGHQPMKNNECKNFIVYNGMVYNFNEIRETLEKKGYKFTSNSDTEVILYSYEEWGFDCVEKFNGMWAFAIYDMEKKIVFISRDRFGIKPFFYHYDGENLIFSSEIKGIFSNSKIKREQNDKTIFDYLYFNLLDHTENTFFKGIKRLMPGHNAIFNIKKRELKIWKYYDLEKKVNEKDTKDKKNFRDIFFNAVKSYLVADVSVGSCLSGGLDSSSIVCVMREILPKKEIKTFSLVFPGKKIDESKYQNEVVEKCHLQQFKTTFEDEDILRDLEDLIRTQDEPFGGLSIYGQYRVMKIARENGLKVMLDGQGGDEILGGYSWFFGYYFTELFLKYKWVTLIKEIISYRKCHKNLVPLNYSFLILAPRFITKFLWTRRFKYLNRKFLEEYRGGKEKDILWDSRSFNDISFLAETYFSLPSLLRYEDKNSMKWGIESRVPFCDHELVEYVLSLPANMKIKTDVAKIILRESLKDILPEMIRNRRDKIGFTTPDDAILRTEQGSRFTWDIITSECFMKRRYWDQEKVKKMLQDHLDGRKNNAKELWKMIILEIWLRLQIDTDKQMKEINETSKKCVYVS
jgi:asparagine synthase (glutamine-hydrolysing)